MLLTTLFCWKAASINTRPFPVDSLCSQIEARDALDVMRRRVLQPLYHVITGGLK